MTERNIYINIHCEDHLFKNLKSTNEFYLVALELRVELIISGFYLKWRESFHLYYCLGNLRTELFCLYVFYPCCLWRDTGILLFL